MKIAVIIVTHKRKTLLERCLDSLYAQEDHPLLLETSVIINGVDEVTEQFLNKRFPNLNVLPLSQKETPGGARNKALEKISEEIEYILFLDDDVELPTHYFKVAAKFLRSGPTLLGGPDLTHPNSDAFQRILGLAQQSPLCTAHTRYRHHPGVHDHNIAPDGSEFILCNLWFHPKVFKEYKLRFDDRFQRNEENVLIYQVLGKSQNFIFSSDLFVFHEKKTNIPALCRAVFSSGLHRALSFILYPKSFNLLYLAPLAFICYLLSLQIIGLSFLSLLPLFLYTGLSLFYSYRLTSTIKDTSGVWAMHFLIIFTYGLGTLAGLITALYYHLESKTRSQH